MDYKKQPLNFLCGTHIKGFSLYASVTTKVKVVPCMVGEGYWLGCWSQTLVAGCHLSEMVPEGDLSIWVSLILNKLVLKPDFLGGVGCVGNRALHDSVFSVMTGYTSSTFSIPSSAFIQPLYVFFLILSNYKKLLEGLHVPGLEKILIFQKPDHHLIFIMNFMISELETSAMFLEA